MKQLGEIIKIIKGGKAPEVFEEPIMGAHRYIQTDDLRADTKPRYAIDKDGLLAKKTDVLIAWDGSVGVVGFNLEGYVGSTIAILRPTYDGIYAPYLGYFLKSKFNEIQENKTGATIPHVNRGHLESLRLPIPSYPEQHRIVSELSRADRLRRLRRYGASLTASFLQSVFLEMFGDPSINFKKYKKVALSDLELTDGIKCGPFGTQLSKSEYKSYGIPLWGIKQVNSRFNIPANDFLSNEKANDLSTYSLQPGDIVMTRKGTIGNCSVYPVGFPVGIMHSDLLRIRIDEEKCNEYFLSWQLTLSWDVEHQISMISGGAIMEGINVGKLKSITVILPPLPEQQQFAKFVRRVESLRRRQTESARQGEELFQALLAKSFTTA
jgi:type I restriction enzyme S subunit